MSICPKNKSSKARRDSRRANWKMSNPTLVKCSKCGALMVPHRVCKACGILQQEGDHSSGGLISENRRTRKERGESEGFQRSFLILLSIPAEKFSCIIAEDTVTYRE